MGSETNKHWYVGLEKLADVSTKVIFRAKDDYVRASSRNISKVVFLQAGNRDPGNEASRSKLGN